MAKFYLFIYFLQTQRQFFSDFEGSTVVQTANNFDIIFKFLGAYLSSIQYYEPEKDATTTITSIYLS